jgi:hypothetical protein
VPNALKHRVRAVTAGEFAHLLDAGLTSLSHRVGRAVFDTQVRSRLVPCAFPSG